MQRALRQAEKYIVRHRQAASAGSGITPEETAFEALEIRSFNNEVIRTIAQVASVHEDKQMEISMLFNSAGISAADATKSASGIGGGGSRAGGSSVYSGRSLNSRSSVGSRAGGGTGSSSSSRLDT